LESIPRLHKSLKIRAQNLSEAWQDRENDEVYLKSTVETQHLKYSTTNTSVQYMKDKDKDDNFWIEAKKNEYIRTSTIEGTKKNEFICSLTIKGTKTNQSICSSTIEGMKKN
jgi:hypothetical protein